MRSTTITCDNTGCTKGGTTHNGAGEVFARTTETVIDDRLPKGWVTVLNHLGDRAVEKEVCCFACLLDVLRQANGSPNRITHITIGETAD